MGLMNIFKKEEPQKFSDMSRKEKKNFLSNDLIERMIRIEQRLTGSFGGGLVAYYQTEYYKGLSEQEKLRYKKYLASKEKRKKWRFLPFVIIIAAGFFISSGATGNVIGSDSFFSAQNLILIGIFVLALLIYLEIVISNRARWKRMESHFAVLERIISKRKSRRD